MSKIFMNKWLKFVEKLQMNPSLQDEVYLTRKFATEQNNLVEELIHSKRSVQNMSSLQRDSMLEVVTFKAWYLMFFLYTTEQGIACILPNSELELHLSVKESESERSLPPIMPRQGRQSPTTW
jgi:hypothetical protein